jgi:hypothetical protein
VCPGQGCDVCTHAPAPLQAPTGVEVDPVQLAVPQLAPALAFRQAPAPSQVPSNPQGGLAVQRACGSALAAGTGWHDPAAPVRLQTRQVPQLDDEQQTPSTQLSLAHSAAAEQIWPSRLSPHTPAVQVLPGAQSSLVTQTDTQVWLPALQANGVQPWVVAGLQVPAPSQLRASVATVESAGHDGAAHCVPAA